MIGFGGNKLDFSVPPKYLQRVTIKIYHSFDVYNCHVNFLSLFNPNTMLYAGSSIDGTGVCFGGSGGPLIAWRNDGQQIVVGVSSR